MELAQADIETRVAAELATIRDTEVRTALSALLTPPERHMRTWDWHSGLGDAPRYPCWLVIRHEQSDTGIVFSESGFGPEHPWGLVFLSRDGFGADSAWFASLEEAFCDSYAASPLPIWNVVRVLPDGTREVLYESLTLDVAFETRDQSRSGDADRTLHVQRRVIRDR